MANDGRRPSRKSDRNDQGELGRIRRSAVHRPARQVAAHRPARLDHRRGRVPRRHHVRRLVDRRLEGDQRERHDPDAGSATRGDGSVRGQAEPDPVLRHRRALDRPALRPRPARDRQAGRGLCEVDRHRRHRLCRPRGRVLHVRRRASSAPAATTACYQIDSIEGPGSNTDRTIRKATWATARASRAAISRSPPVDSDSDLRAEMLSTMGEMGLPIEKHHHEVAQRQHELGTKFGTLTTMADQMQIYKYCRAQRRPQLRQDGDLHAEADLWRQRLGHAHPQSIWKDGKPLFAGNGYADLSETVPVLHRRHHQARQGAQRVHQPDRPTATSG